MIPRKSKGVYTTDSISTAGMELIKWLFFRLMFQSGYGKILSGCPAWKNLDAMRTHFQSQPIPHIGSWYAHNGQGTLSKDIMSASTIYFETLMPLMIYLPIRYFRRMAVILQSLLMVAIMMTGNYNFFNLLTIAAGLGALDDEALQSMCPSWKMSLLGLDVPIANSDLTPLEIKQRSGASKTSPLVFGVFNSDIISILSFWCLNAFAFYKLFLVQSEAGVWDVNRDYQDFFKALNTSENLNLLLIWILITAMIALFFSYKRMTGDPQADRQMQTGPSTIFTVVGACVFVVMYLLSLPGFGASMGHKAESITLLQGTANGLLDIQRNIGGLKIVNSYGLFRKMTGLTGTPVLVLSGNMKPVGSSEASKWHEIEIEGKLGDLKTMPGIYIPCQRRVPWQMWFSALEENVLSPHFLNLIFKIGEKKESYGELIKVRDDKDSKKLRQLSDFEISDLKITRYLYSFENQTTFENTGRYWERKMDESFQELTIPRSEFFKFEKYLDTIGVLTQGSTLPPPHPMAHYFDWLGFC